MATAQTSAIEGSATIFAVSDIERSLAYYRDALGFNIAFRYGTPTVYAGICRGALTIHLLAAAAYKKSAGHGALSVFVTNVDSLHED